MVIAEPLHLRPSQESITQIQEDVKVETDASIENKATIAFSEPQRSEDETAKEGTAIQETGEVSKPAVSEEVPSFRRALTGGEAVALGAGALTVGADAATSGAGNPASGALSKVDGAWKRIVQNLTIRKAHVDHVCPIAKTAYVYYDDEVYDSVLTEKSTGITYVTQLLFDSESEAYFVYYRGGETDYKLDGPHDTIESAKDIFQITYKEKFDVEWKERETTTSEKWTYGKTYETYEEVEEVQENVEETEVIIRWRQYVFDHKRTTGGEVLLEHGTEETVDLEEDNEPFILKKMRSLAGGKKGGSAGLSTTAIAAVIGASQN
ncbi:hypothetical protein BGZ72_007275 [Mortierella alpina]|nr:hypothetical protein BGZ72_007275 [Mortierella alpina]